MIKRILPLICFILTFSYSSNAQSLNKIQGYAERGGYNVQTSTTVTHKVQGSYPSSTVTVYLTGTTTTSSIFSDSSGSIPKSNPFTADSNAFYSFYITDGCYDIKFSGTGISSPFTISRVCVREQIIQTLSSPTPTPVPPPTNNLGSKTYYAREHGAILDGSKTGGTGSSTNDTTAIQDILDLASTGQPITLIVDGGIASVNQIKVYSYTTIKCTAGGGFALRDGTNKTLLINANRTTGTIVDTNIVIEGCYFNFNSTNQTGIGLFNTQQADGTLIGGIQLYGIKDSKLKSLSCYHSKTICFHFANSINTTVDDLTFDNNVSGQFQQGGLQYSGANSNGIATNLKGTTQDDFLAYNPDDADWINGSFTGLGPYIDNGDITDMVASNLEVNNVYEAIRYFNSTSRLDRINVSNVTGTVFQNLFSNDPLNLTPGNVGTFTISNVKISTTPQVYPGVGAIFDIHGRAENLIFNNIEVESINDSRSLIKIASDAEIQHLTFNGLRYIENNAATVSAIPVNVGGFVREFNINNGFWSRADYLAINSNGFIRFTSADGHIEQLTINGMHFNRSTYLVGHFSGRLGTVLANNIFHDDADGGATITTSGTISGPITLSNWYGNFAVPSFGTAYKKLGNAFPIDSTVPTISSIFAIGGSPIVTISFSEGVNSSNFAYGATIKKNTVTQTILFAARRPSDPNIVDYTLSTNIAGSDTVTFDYSGGNIEDLAHNPLSTIVASSATVIGTEKVLDQFNTTDGTLLNGKASSPVAGFGNWTLDFGTSANQKVLANRGYLDAPINVTEGAYIDANTANGTLSAKLEAWRFHTSDAGMGIRFRESNSSNYWLYWLSKYNVAMYKVVAGVPTAINSISTRTYLDVPYFITCSLSGNNISCSANGINTISTVDSFNNTATRYGIHGRAGQLTFDNFEVRQ